MARPGARCGDLSGLVGTQFGRRNVRPSGFITDDRLNIAQAMTITSARKLTIQDSKGPIQTTPTKFSTGVYSMAPSPPAFEQFRVEGIQPKSSSNKDTGYRHRGAAVADIQTQPTNLITHNDENNAASPQSNTHKPQLAAGTDTGVVKVISQETGVLKDSSRDFESEKLKSIGNTDPRCGRSSPSSLHAATGSAQVRTPAVSHELLVEGNSGTPASSSKDSMDITERQSGGGGVYRNYPIIKTTAAHEGAGSNPSPLTVSEKPILEPRRSKRQTASPNRLTTDMSNGSSRSRTTSSSSHDSSQENPTEDGGTDWSPVSVIVTPKSSRSLFERKDSIATQDSSRSSGTKRSDQRVFREQKLSKEMENRRHSPNQKPHREEGRKALSILDGTARTINCDTQVIKPDKASIIPGVYIGARKQQGVIHSGLTPRIERSESIARLKIKYSYLQTKWVNYVNTDIEKQLPFLSERNSASDESKNVPDTTKRLSEQFTAPGRQDLKTTDTVQSHRVSRREFTGKASAVYSDSENSTEKLGMISETIVEKNINGEKMFTPHDWHGVKRVDGKTIPGAGPPVRDASSPCKANTGHRTSSHQASSHSRLSTFPGCSLKAKTLAAYLNKGKPRSRMNPDHNANSSASPAKMDSSDILHYLVAKKKECSARSPTRVADTESSSASTMNNAPVHQGRLDHNRRAVGRRGYQQTTNNKDLTIENQHHYMTEQTSRHPELHRESVYSPYQRVGSHTRRRSPYGAVQETSEDHATAKGMPKLVVADSNVTAMHTPTTPRSQMDMDEAGFAKERNPQSARNSTNMDNPKKKWHIAKHAVIAVQIWKRSIEASKGLNDEVADTEPPQLGTSTNAHRCDEVVTASKASQTPSQTEVNKQPISSQVLTTAETRHANKTVPPAGKTEHKITGILDRTNTQKFSLEHGSHRTESVPEHFRKTPDNAGKADLKSVTVDVERQGRTDIADAGRFANARIDRLAEPGIVPATKDTKSKTNDNDAYPVDVTEPLGAGIADSTNHADEDSSDQAGRPDADRRTDKAENLNRGTLVKTHYLQDETTHNCHSMKLDRDGQIKIRFKLNNAKTLKTQDAKISNEAAQTTETLETKASSVVKIPAIAVRQPTQEGPALAAPTPVTESTNAPSLTPTSEAMTSQVRKCSKASASEVQAAASDGGATHKVDGIPAARSTSSLASPSPTPSPSPTLQVENPTTAKKRVSASSSLPAAAAATVTTREGVASHPAATANSKAAPEATTQTSLLAPSAATKTKSHFPTSAKAHPTPSLASSTKASASSPSATATTPASSAAKKASASSSSATITTSSPSAAATKAFASSPSATTTVSSPSSATTTTKASDVSWERVHSAQAHVLRKTNKVLVKGSQRRPASVMGLDGERKLATRINSKRQPSER